MPIEPTGETTFQLDSIWKNNALDRGIFSLSEKNLFFITLEASGEDTEKIRSALCAIRAANLAAVLLLKRPENQLDLEKVASLIVFLREWDQLLLHNILQLCEHLVPAEFRPAFWNESKIELKWFREWVSASQDPRIYKVPGLPWRSFIRKIVQENFEFADDLLSMPEDNLKELLVNFLAKKKKVVCLFPKRWSKLQ